MKAVKLDVDLDKTLKELGQYGRYQKQNYFLILVVIIFSAVNNSQYVFCASQVKARCLLEHLKVLASLDMV
ncbi:unnamed protein product, partial [Brenthis ino]